MYVITNRGELEIDPSLRDWEFEPRWRTIPGYPEYVVNYAGDVQRKKDQKKMTVKPNFSVRLLDPSGRSREVKLDMVDIFPEVYALRFE